MSGTRDQRLHRRTSLSAYGLKRANRRLAVCSGAHDPHPKSHADHLAVFDNVGAIFRSVAALGADGVLLTPACADPLYRRAVRVSMGAVLQMPWARLPEWRDAGPTIRDAGYELAPLALREWAVRATAGGVSA